MSNFLDLKCGIKWFFGRRVAKFIVVGGVEEASCLSISGFLAQQPIPS